MATPPTDGASRKEEKLDEMIEETFPASDPPSTTPPSGTRRSEQQREADRTQGGTPGRTGPGGR